MSAIGCEGIVQRTPQEGSATALPTAPSEPLSTSVVGARPAATRMPGAGSAGANPPYPAPTTQAPGYPEPTAQAPQAQRGLNDEPQGDGLWLPHDVLMQLPTDGAAWDQLLSVVSQQPPQPDIYDKDDDGDVLALARALVYRRTGESAYREAVVTMLQQVMAQDIEPRRTSILSVARNLPSYIIAADLIALHEDALLDQQFRDWLRTVRDIVYSGDGGSHTIASCHETRPNNFGSHCGAARIAIALYLDDDSEVQRAADVFHGWLGNRDAYAGFSYGRLSWQADPQKPVAINPPDAVKEGRNIGGALPEEMRRAGDFRWPPKRTGYVWEALQGALVQAELLARAGYDAWEWEDRALLRAVEFLYDLGWEPNGDDTWQPWLINYVYDAGLPTTTPTRAGKNMGWTDWTHAATRVEVDADLSSSAGYAQNDPSGENE